MMPSELKSLYRCLLGRKDTVVSCDQAEANEFHIVVQSTVLYTVGPRMGSTRGQLFFIQLSPKLTGEDYNK